MLAVFVGRYDERVTGIFEKPSKAELSRDATEEFSRLEVDSLRAGGRLAIRIGFDFWNIVTGIALRIAVDGVVIENAYNLCHGCLLSLRPRSSARKLSMSLREDHSSMPATPLPQHE